MTQKVMKVTQKTSQPVRLSTLKQSEDKDPKEVRSRDMKLTQKVMKVTQKTNQPVRLSTLKQSEGKDPSGGEEQGREGDSEGHKGDSEVQSTSPLISGRHRL